MAVGKPDWLQHRHHRSTDIHRFRPTSLRRSTRPKMDHLHHASVQYRNRLDYSLCWPISVQTSQLRLEPQPNWFM